METWSLEKVLEQVIHAAHDCVIEYDGAFSFQSPITRNNYVVAIANGNTLRNLSRMSDNTTSSNGQLIFHWSKNDHRQFTVHIFYNPRVPDNIIRVPEADDVNINDWIKD